MVWDTPRPPTKTPSPSIPTLPITNQLRTRSRLPLVPASRQSLLHMVLVPALELQQQVQQQDICSAISITPRARRARLNMLINISISISISTTGTLPRLVCPHMLPVLIMP